MSKALDRANEIYKGDTPITRLRRERLGAELGRHEGATHYLCGD